MSDVGEGYRVPGDKTLYRMDPMELNEDEIVYYNRALETDPHCGGARVVLEAIVSGDAQMFCYNDGETILIYITRMVNSPDGYRELLLHMLAGGTVDGKSASSLENHIVIAPQLMDYAVRNRCHRIIGYMNPELWEKMQHTSGKQWKAEYVQCSLSPEDAGHGD